MTLATGVARFFFIFISIKDQTLLKYLVLFVLNFEIYFKEYIKVFFNYWLGVSLTFFSTNN